MKDIILLVFNFSTMLPKQEEKALELFVFALILLNNHK